MELETMTLQDFLGGLPDCACGRPHRADIRRVVLRDGALDLLGESLRAVGAGRVFVLSEQTTDRVAGQRVRQALDAQGVAHTHYRIEQEEVVPDEAVLGGVLMGFDPACDFVLGVGSGVINDVSRFLSFRLGLPFGIVATAPSMDGFASTVAPLITNSLKTTYAAHAPRLILADLDILANAPARLIAAGFADVAGKLNSLTDWRISALVNGEYYCPRVAAVMRLALDRTLDCKDGLASRDKQAVAQLMEALVLAGLAMSFADNSRPASGCEHHLSHYWEMHFLATGRKLVPHGVKVGIGTVVALRLADKLRRETPDWAALERGPVPPMDAAWEAEMVRAFGAAAPEVIALECKVGKNAPERRAQRLAATRAHWPEIVALLSALPSAETVDRLLADVGGARRPSDVDLSPQAVRDGILYAKEVRDRYTIQQLSWDLGLLPRYAEEITRDLFL